MAPVRKNRVKLLDDLYHGRIQPSFASYKGVQQLLRAAKQLDRTINEDEVVGYLKTQESYTRHKARRFRFPRQKVIGSGIYTDMQVKIYAINMLVLAIL